MRVNQRALVMIVFGVTVLITGCAAQRVRGGPPAGPIIVVAPDPEPSTGVRLEQNAEDDTTPTVQCPTGQEPCWYLGSFDSDHYENLPDHISRDSAPNEDPPRLPHYLNHVAGVSSMQVRLKADPKLPIKISKIELTFESGKKLVIEVKNAGDVPVWTYDTKTVEGKRFRSRKKLPRLFMEKITDVTVVKRADQPNDPVTIGTLYQFRMYYQQ